MPAAVPDAHKEAQALQADISSAAHAAAEARVHGSRAGRAGTSYRLLGYKLHEGKLRLVKYKRGGGEGHADIRRKACQGPLIGRLLFWASVRRAPAAATRRSRPHPPAGRSASRLAALCHVHPQADQLGCAGAATHRAAFREEVAPAVGAPRKVGAQLAARHAVAAGLQRHGQAVGSQPDALAGRVAHHRLLRAAHLRRAAGARASRVGTGGADPHAAVMTNSRKTAGNVLARLAWAACMPTAMAASRGQGRCAAQRAQERQQDCLFGGRALGCAPVRQAAQPHLWQLDGARGEVAVWPDEEEGRDVAALLAAAAPAGGVVPAQNSAAGCSGRRWLGARAVR